MKRVTIFCNGSQSNGKIVPLNENFDEFLVSISEKLKITANRVFLSSGGEVDDTELIRDNDVLYISAGENFLGGASTYSNGWITLNVGGKHFTTSKSNITEKEPYSMLARMFAEENNHFLMNPSSKDASGAFLIDRSPLYFEPILNYLRNGQIIIDSGVNPQGILEEARFYGIESMVPQLESHIQNEVSKTKDNAPLTRQEVIRALIMTKTNEDLRFQGVNLAGANLNRLDLRNINFKLSLSFVFAVIKNTSNTEKIIYVVPSLKLRQVKNPQAIWVNKHRTKLLPFLIIYIYYVWNEMRNEDLVLMTSIKEIRNYFPDYPIYCCL